MDRWACIFKYMIIALGSNNVDDAESLQLHTIQAVIGSSSSSNNNSSYRGRQAGKQARKQH